MAACAKQATPLYTSRRQAVKAIWAFIPLVLAALVARAASPADTIVPIDSVGIAGVRSQAVIPPKVLMGKELAQLGGLSVADALRYFAGLQLKDYGGIGGLKTVNIRSMGSNHAGVFYDGIQLGNAQNGVVDLGKFSLDNAASIELYHGQKSGVLQSARDFGSAGSIYITTRRPQFEPGQRTHLTAQVRCGSFGLLNPSVLWEYRISPRVSTTFNAEWVAANGEYHFRYRQLTPSGRVAYDTTALRKNGDINALRMEFGLYGTLPKIYWQLRGYLYSSERGLPGAIVSNVWSRGERLGDLDAFMQGRLEYAPTRWYTALLAVKYAHDATRYTNLARRMLFAEKRYQQREIYLSTAHSVTLAPWCHATLAYDLQWNSLAAHDELANAAPPLFPYPVRYIHYGAMAITTSLKGFKGQASLVGIHSQNRVQRFAQPPNRTLVTPGLFIAYTPWKSLGINLNAFYKHSYRLPTFNDLYYADLGNANLKPEYAIQRDVGIQWAKDWEGPIRHTEVSLDTYHNTVRDKIIAYPKGRQFRWTMINLGYVKIQGLEAAGTLMIAPAASWRLYLKGQYTYQRAQDYTSPKDSYYGHQIPYIPRYSGTAIVAVSYRGYSLNYSFIYTGERYHQQENTAYNYTLPWYTSDISLRAVYQAVGLRFSATLEVCNLLNQPYEVVANYPMPGRNYRIRIGVEM